MDKAFQHGYYKEMVALIRSLFSRALKTNDFLQFAVLTGCLRVSKESIFTGLNNFDVNSIIDVEHDEQFGFTEAEVQELLQYYDREAAAPVMKAWYDGYRFGNADVYCPWDVINYAKKLLANPQAEPQAFWINSSGNDLVKRFVDKADKTTQDEIERLIAGAEALGSGEEGTIAYLRTLYQLLEQAGYGRYVRFDLGLVHQIDYYTGVVFRGYVVRYGVLLVAKP